jgi:ribosomal protein L21E
MSEFAKGDRVRVDIPDTTDPDFDRYHGSHGEVREVLEDDAGNLTGDKEDDLILRVELDSGEIADFRRRDLRPPLNEDQ